MAATSADDKNKRDNGKDIFTVLNMMVLQGGEHSEELRAEIDSIPNFPFSRNVSADTNVSVDTAGGDDFKRQVTDNLVKTPTIGSINHPHSCVECQHFFFTAAGCMNGANCTYCHEVHPRRNRRKNRKFMNMAIATRRATVEDVAAAEYSYPVAGGSKTVERKESTDESALHDNSDSAGTRTPNQTASSIADDDSHSNTSYSSSTPRLDKVPQQSCKKEIRTPSPPTRTPEISTVDDSSYGSYSRSESPAVFHEMVVPPPITSPLVSAPITSPLGIPILTLYVGQSCSLFPGGVTENQQFSSLVFSVHPRLPQGLFFDTRTGGVSGTPQVACEREVYTIVVHAAESPTNRPVNSCKIGIEVLTPEWLGLPLWNVMSAPPGY